jgi:hypothetical protein
MGIDIRKKWNLNFTCIVISVIPLILLAMYYPELNPSPTTKIFGSNGMALSKGGFALLLSGLCVFSYFFSIYLVSRSAMINVKINKVGVRILVNSIFMILVVLLIRSNLV